ncbi:uncharacterized protein AB675_7672 [Cyphellophora attinorum]|uniref:Uncharacterized protein n=1 Tax=Cyphellophora attinorum TaxID=1664694 RepID=A0A0N1H9Q4_9EURO|nr:uncharacterized protein AB675_7672 [Phialophora attinorum]KPI40337.1 hypothetical protein AB675_7672 [Phialophora attinorum]
MDAQPSTTQDTGDVNGPLQSPESFNEDSEVDPQDTTLATKPFRILDLPFEIRKMVYEHLFVGARLMIDVPGNGRRLRVHLGAYQTQTSRLPGALIVCKLIRTESLPIFARSLRPEFYDSKTYGWPPVTPPARRVPAHYLCEARSIFVSTPDSDVVSLLTMPKLEEVHFGADLKHLVKYPEDGAPLPNYIRKGVIDMYADDFEEECRDIEALKASPVRILLGCHIIYYTIGKPASHGLDFTLDYRTRTIIERGELIDNHIPATQAPVSS